MLPATPSRDDVLAKAEAVRHGPAPTDEPPPAYPTTFGPDFLPPAHSVKPLQTKFSTARDERICFYEAPHVYLIDGKAYDCSVTTLVKAHVEEFDAALCIQRMRTSRREAWPRLKYAFEPVRLDSLADAPPEQLVLAVTRDTQVTVCAVPSDDPCAADKLAAKCRRYEAGAGVDLYATPRAMTDDEIVATWDEAKVEASNRGTWIHWQLELWSNSLPCHVDAELLHGLRFVGDVLRPMGVRCWATEMEVFGEVEQICGSVDWIGYYEDDPDSLIIVDWKRSKKLDTELVSGYRKRMTPPLQHLDDADGCKYALQLGCYAFLLEKYYGKRVRALALCCVHDEHAMYTFVPYLKAEVAFLMRRRCETICARIRVDMDDADGSLPRCSITGDILHDGVWCEVDGSRRLCNRKDALVRYPKAPTEDAADETKWVQDLLAQVVTVDVSEEEKALAGCTPWSELMPMDGLPVPPSPHSPPSPPPPPT